MACVGDDELTALLDGLRRDRRRHPYAGRREYSDTARRLADRCATLVEAGDAATAAPVLRKAVDRMTTALMYLDDSSGIIGDDLREIMGLYARACAAAPPNPKTLAGWLVKLTFDGPGWPQVRLREFAPALGPAGLVHVANLVEHRQSAGDLDNGGQRFAVRDLREQLAELSGDVDRYVAELARNLTHADQYRTITAALRRADRTPEAIVWARRGLAEKGSWPNAERLRDLLVDLLIDVGEGSAALAERRAESDRRPTRAAYRDLIDTAARVGAEGQQEWAVRVLTDRTVRDPRHASELVAVLLTEGMLEQAW